MILSISDFFFYLPLSPPPLYPCLPLIRPTPPHTPPSQLLSFLSFLYSPPARTAPLPLTPLALLLPVLPILPANSLIKSLAMLFFFLNLSLLLSPKATHGDRVHGHQEREFHEDRRRGDVDG